MSKPEIKILEKLYQPVDGMRISLAERERLHIEDSSFTYGEINPETFGLILETAKPQENEIFYDLGAGAGKAVFCAALLYNWQKCCGVEILPGLYEVSQVLLKNFLKMPELKHYFPTKQFSIEFIQEDLTKIDFSDADVLFLHATTFGPMLWDVLLTKLTHLKIGSRVIVNTKQLRSDDFEKIHEEVFLMGWGDSTVFTYKKIK